MKRIMIILLVVCGTLVVVSCSQNASPTDSHTRSLSQPQITEQATMDSIENPPQTQQTTVSSAADLYQSKTEKETSAFNLILTPNMLIAEEPEESTKQPFEGKIAIITISNYSADRDYDAGEAIVNKYGKDKVIHATWPDGSFGDVQKAVDVVTALGSDPDVKAIIIFKARHGTNMAIDKLREQRSDIFL